MQTFEQQKHLILYAKGEANKHFEIQNSEQIKVNGEQSAFG